MDTISTIAGPSITRLWPLVGGSLASDWVRFLKSNRGCPTMYHLNVEVDNHSPSYILVIPLCICILKANGHHQHHCRALHHTSVSTCWRFSCLRLGQSIFEIEPAAGQCMAIAQRHASLSFLDIDRGGTDKIFNSIPTVASKNSTCSFYYLSLTTQNHAWRR